MATDDLAPYSRFDGSGGSLLTTSGWTRQERAELNGVTVAASAAVDDRSKFIFLRPDNGAYDLHLRCNPADALDPRNATLRVFRDELELARGELQAGWNDLRIPLPAGALVEGLNELSLSFGDPYQGDQGATPARKDRRRWAKCTELAVLPRGSGGLGDVIDEHGSEPGENGARSVTLGAYRSLSIPLPASSKVTIRLDTDPPSQHAALALLQIDRDAARPLVWPSGDSTLSFRTRAIHSRVRISARSPEPEAAQAGAGLNLTLTPGSLATAPSRGWWAPKRPPNVFIFLVDTLRTDAVGRTWQGLAAAPNLDAFRREAVTFSRARTASSWTLPSVVSILSGVYPFRHGVMKGDTRYTDDRFPSLPETLATVGYQTVGISQSWVASSSFGVDRGFARFVLSEQLNGVALRSQDLRKAFRLWYLGEAAAEKPIFAYLHGVDPHMPYTPPTGRYREAAVRFPGNHAEADYMPKSLETRTLAAEPREVLHLRALYQGEVLYADEQFGRFLDLLRLLDLYDEALVVFVADHGEEFAEHGAFGHGRTLYEDQLLVPLVVKFPRSRWAGRVVDADVSTVDLVPTILENAGVPATGLVLDGQSLTQIIDGAPAHLREIFSEVNPVANATSPEVDWKALVVGSTKCLHSGNRIDNLGRPVPEWTYLALGPELYDERPLAETSAAALDCKRRLARWLRVAARARSGAGAEGVGQEELEKLRALGYIR